uniref:Protein regulator of cytokinesis 1b n=1 Tax=Periophthalmus magnuspinnatus TaxID=409849 RepID=A0A3B4B8Z1_9GOBI
LRRKAEVLAAEAVSCLNKALILLKDVWEEIGIPEDQRLQRTNTVKNHIRGLLEMMIAEEHSLKLRLEESIESSRREIQQLCLQLDLPPPQEDNGQTILQAEKDLRTRVDLLLKEKSKRMEQLKDLLREDLELAEILGTPPSTVSPTNVPSTRTLDDLRQHLANQRKEKSQREDQFRSLRAQILVLVSDLDHSPDSGLESDLLQSDPDEFCLSSENLHTLGLLLERVRPCYHRLLFPENTFNLLHKRVCKCDLSFKSLLKSYLFCKTEFSEL